MLNLRRPSTRPRARLLVIVVAGFLHLGCATPQQPPSGSSPRSSVGSALAKEGEIAVFAAVGLAAVPLVLAVPFANRAPTRTSAAYLPSPATDVTLEEAYWIAFGVYPTSGRVDQQTGQLGDPRLRGRLSTPRASSDMQRLLRRHQLVAEPFAIASVPLPGGSERTLLLAVVRRGDVAPGAPPQVLPDGFVPERPRDTVLDWVVLDLAVLESDRAYATLIAVAANDVLHGTSAADFWGAEEQWRAGRIAAVRALSDERTHHVLEPPRVTAPQIP